MNKPFGHYSAHAVCRHCGCKQSEHRAAHPAAGDNAHNCPSIHERGVAKPFPRTTYKEDQSRDFRDYWRRVAAYWETPTTFDPEIP